MAGIRIDALPTTVLPSPEHEVPAMKDGLSVKLTLEQVGQVMLALGLIDADTAQTLTNKTLTAPTLTLKQSAAAAPTASGDIQLDTTTEALVVGDGAAASVFPRNPAGVVSGDLFYANGARTQARLAKGTALQGLRMNAGATAPEWGDQVFSKGYTSAQQTITSAGALTLAHGLGSKPKAVEIFLVCQTAEGGYSIGDEVFATWHMDTSNGRGIAIVSDATNLNCRFGSSGGVFVAIHKTTGVIFNLTSANWRLVVRAFA